MTALDRYAKLEAVGWYVAGPGTPPREVVLSFGARSLMIAGLDDVPIAHWPLASLSALGPPGAVPVALVPDPASAERVTLDDPDMVAAIAEVCPRLHRPSARPARRGRWRRWAVGAAVVLALGAGAWALPRVSGWLLASVDPGEADRLGEALAQPVLATLGQPPRRCTGAEGSAALATLLERLAYPPGIRVSVIDADAPDALALPGGRILLFRGLIETVAGPEALAGVLVHQRHLVELRVPLSEALDALGWGGRAALAADTLPESGDLGRIAAALAGPAAPGEDAPTAERAAEARAIAAATAMRVRRDLAAAGLPAAPFARALGRLDGRDGGATGYAARFPALAAALDGETAPPAPFRAALSDRDWLALATICERTSPLGARR